MTTRLNSKLRQWRVDNGLTLQEVADLTGVDFGHLSKAERGLAGFSPLRRVAMARRLGVHVADLFEVEPLESEPAETEAAP